MILAVTAALLAYESKGLLIGETASALVLQDIRNIIGRNTDILSINEILTMHFGPKDILLTLSLDFVDGISAGRVEEVISQLESEIKTQCPEVTRVFIEAQSIRGHAASQKSNGVPGES